MIPKLVAFLLTMAVLIAAGIIILMLMLVAMNGYAESDAMWGLGIYVVMVLFVTAAMSTGAMLLTKRLVSNQFTSLAALLISIPVFSIVGIVVEAICSLIGVVTAEIVRVNF